MTNDLALIQAIRRRLDTFDERMDFIETLEAAAVDAGLSEQEIDDALASDRQLVIYEP